MRSEPLKKINETFSKKKLGRPVAIADLKKASGNRRPQGLIWELRQWGAEIDPVKEGRKAVAYRMTKRPKLAVRKAANETIS